MNVNELLIDRVRMATTHKLDTNDLWFRLTSLEDPSLQCTAEGEEVTDAIGSLITTLYRAKNAIFSSTNSLFSLDLAAAQLGAEKEVASEDKQIETYLFEILTVEDGKVTLSNTPNKEIKEIHSIVDGEIGTRYVAGATVSDTEFVANGTEIQVPTGVTGKVFVEYTYLTSEAVQIVNKTGEYPEACKLLIYCIFKDKCNENIKYAGVIVCEKAKLNPESIELALTTTGKHPFEFKMQKDYCNDEEELFRVIVYK